MKKFLLASFVTTAAVATANAGSISLDMRADYLSQTYNSDAIAAGPSTVDNNKFYLQTGRVDFQGKLNDETSYRLRWRFAGKDQATLQKRDNTFQDVDYAFIANKLNDFMTLTIGKFGGDIGGFEGANSGAEMYFTSEAYNGTSYLGGFAATAPKSLTGFTNLLYYSGAKLAFTFADQEINIQGANVDTSNGRGASFATSGGDHTTTGVTTGKFDQNQALYAISYKGKFADNWQVRASYHTMKTEPAVGLDGKIDYMAVGGQFQNESWLVQLDYLMNTYKETNAAETGTDTLSSIVATGKWMFHDNWTGILKVAYSMEKFDDATSADNKYTSEGLAFEYKPKKDDMYRYHVAYNNRTMAPDQGSDRNLQEVIVGTRIMADFLK
ncbi:MAG: porin [Bdellovibrio sp.]